MPVPLAFDSDGYALTAEYNPPRGKPTIVLCHGFPGFNRNEETAEALARLGYGTLLFQYRGVRDNPGEYSFEGNEADIVSAIAAVKARKGDEHGLGLLGYSLGGFHAARIASFDENLVQFLVLMAPLASLRKLRDAMDAREPGTFEAFIVSGKELLKGDPGAWLEEIERFAPEEEPYLLASRMQIPALMLHGTADHEIPIEHGRMLRRAWGGPAHLIELPMGHDFRGSGAKVAAEVDRFLGTWGPI
ncbi:MAG: alpha/beta hydrolase family protein [Methanobacteriota archaeon]